VVPYLRTFDYPAIFDYPLVLTFRCDNLPVRHYRYCPRNSYTQDFFACNISDSLPYGAYFFWKVGRIKPFPRNLAFVRHRMAGYFYCSPIHIPHCNYIKTKGNSSLVYTHLLCCLHYANLLCELLF